MGTELKNLVIFGAKSIALGACLAIRELYPDCNVIGFMVSSMKGNAASLCGLPVRETVCYEDKNVPVLIAVPEDIQESIVDFLNHHGFHNIIRLDSLKESDLMSRYYERSGKFPGLRQNTAEIYMAKFYRDKPLQDTRMFPGWIKPIQAGASLTDVRVAELTDDTGENISHKNPNYCELTVLYWVWKNKLCSGGSARYYGLFHYRRFLDISDMDFIRMELDDVDVLLPYPMIYEPDIGEHHGRYLSESDWKSMLKALNELQPEYAERFQDILKQPYFYNYNLLVAKKDILKDYCEWLFPILQRTEELSMPKGSNRADRYIGYFGESLLTLYFMANDTLKIRHCRRIMLK